VTTFAEYLTAFYPTFLRGPWGKRWAATEGGALDVLAASAKLAAKAGFVALAPSTLLPLHAADAAIEAAPGEGADSLQARIRGAWASRRWSARRERRPRSTATAKPRVSPRSSCTCLFRRVRPKLAR
jgi:hypothetical protein